jgi:leader peptidase (prepilin peptidase)/N-methyltransferase
MVWWLFLSLATGLALGSYVGVLIARLPKEEGWVAGRSRCERCGHQLSAKDLVPVMSYVCLKGKCRYCGVKIGKQWLAVELMAGVGVVMVAYGVWESRMISGVGELGWETQNQWLISLMVLAIFLGLMVILWTDVREQVIPDEVVVFLTLTTAGILSITSWENFGTHLGAMVGGGGFFALLFLITRGKGIGWGDVKLAGLMGLVLGKYVIVALYIAFVVGSVVTLGLVMVGRKKWRQMIALGPFLVIGTWATWILGGQIWNWYAGLLR